jgi:hypothetical protein
MAIAGNWTQRGKPAAAGAGRARKEVSVLRVDAVGAFSPFGFEGLDGVPGLLHRAGHEPADGVLLPGHLFHDLGKRGAVRALEQGDHLGCFASLANALGLGGLGALRRFAGFGVRVAFVPDFATGGATSGAWALTVAFAW